MDKIINISGPMFAGKTEELIRLIERERIINKKCLIIKYYKDLRYSNDNVIISHSNIQYNKCEIKYCESLNEEIMIYIKNNKFDVIGIDEGQFFNNLDIFLHVLIQNNINVIITTLNGDFLQIPFESVSKINSISNIYNLNAKCMECYNSDALYTVRTTQSTERIVIGDNYKAVCYICKQKYNSIENIIERKYKEFVLKLKTIHEALNLNYFKLNIIDSINIKESLFIRNIMSEYEKFKNFAHREMKKKSIILINLNIFNETDSLINEIENYIVLTNIF